MITKLEQFIEAVKGRPKKRLVVARADDAHTLCAVNEAVDLGIIEAILVGEHEAILRICATEGIDADKFSFVEASNEMECVTKAIELINDGRADILMKGLVSTDKYMRGILNKDAGLLPPKGVLSHVAVLEMPMYHKLLIVSDVAIIPDPDLSQKAAIIRYLISTANRLEIQNPKVAIIAPSEQVLPNIRSSYEAAILAKMGDRGQFGQAIIDGPLALDVAMFADIAKTKKLTSPVAGDADCMLFPTLDAANVFFKAATQLCNTTLAGIVVGPKAPCILTSRGDSTKSKLYSIALGALTAK